MEEKKKNKISFAMFLVTIGIVYGDIGTSPMYVMKSILLGNGGIAQVNESFIIGALSLVIWTVTLLTTIKFVLIALRADNNGEGGIFALYSLVKDRGKWLLIPAILGGAALLADGVLTPAVTVTTAIEGLRSIPAMDALLGEGQIKVVIITLAIISVLFFVQHAGTSRIGRVFGPVMLLWFTFLGVTGLLMLLKYPVVLKAFNPAYAVGVLFSDYNKAGFMILGSVFLATTGAEALYSDMGHVGRENIYASYPFVKICLILNYLGQGAWILLNRGDASLQAIEELNPFFMMLPTVLRPVAVIMSSAAAIIASQALITGSYTLVSEAIHLKMLPHLEVRYPSDTKGQIYIDTVNTILWIGCSLVVLFFQTASKMENAYGFSITVAMLTTTVLLAVYLFCLCRRRVLAGGVLLVFGAIEVVFFISSLGKFMHGGYVTVILTLVLMGIMIIFYRGTQLEHTLCHSLTFTDHLDSLRQLHGDETIPLYAQNLVYLENSHSFAEIDRDILYSILDKDPKRAEAYWFISVNTLSEAKTMNYEVETYGTDFIFRVRLNLGFQCEPRVNVYLRQIVQDLLARGELPEQKKIYSIYGPSNVGSFRFCVIHKAIPAKSGLATMDQIMLSGKNAISDAAGNKVKWYGLDTSAVVEETVPLITGLPRSTDTITRKQ